MRKLFPLFLATVLLVAGNLFAQDRCGSVQHEALLRSNNPELESIENFEGWMAKNIAIHKKEVAEGARAASVVKTIPVVFHIIYSNASENISDAQVLSQLDILNEDFRRTNPDASSTPSGFLSVAADCEYEWCLAQTDPDGNLTTGINRVSMSGSPFSMGTMDGSVKPATVWDPTQYCNIWVANLSGGLLGYAQFPNSSGLGGLSTNNGPANTDGVVILHESVGRPPANPFPGPYNRGRTLTHEIGHWVGLRHIWGDGACSADDFCGDTPNSNGSNYGCPTGSSSCSSTDMVENYMDYTDDDCMNIFTLDQKDRMDVVFSVSPRRASLITSGVCSAPSSAPTANITADMTEGCPGTTITFDDASGGAPTSWSWTFPGGSPASSTLESPSVTYATAGTYNVTLTVTNTFGTDTYTATGYITIGGGASVTWFNETFEGGAFPPTGWSLDNPDGNVTWEGSSVAGTAPGSTAARLENYNYNSPGQRDGIITPTLDFSARTGNTLDFEYAHRRYSASEKDSLVIYLSTDGGATWPNRLYANAEDGTGVFATGFTTTANFVPAGVDDWCNAGTVGVTTCPSIDLSAWDGQSNVKLKFENVNDYGNNMYIDNIMLTGSCSAPAAAPDADFTASETSGCAPLTVSFSDASTNAPTSWSWDFDGAAPASSVQNPSATFSTPGMYTISLTATNATGSDTEVQTAYVTVYENPTASTTFAPANPGMADGVATALPLGGTGSYAFTWSNGQTTQTATMLAAGTYSVTVTDGNGCQAVTSVTVTELPLGVEDKTFSDRINLYPNPNNGIFNLIFPLSTNQELQLKLYNPIGQVVYQKKTQNDGPTPIEVNLGGISSGIYFLVIEGDGFTASKKVRIK